MRGGRVGIKASRSWRPVSASDDGGRRVEASKKIRESVPDCPPISAPHLLHASPVIARPRSAPAAQRPKRKRGVREGVTSRCPLAPSRFGRPGLAWRPPGRDPTPGDWNSPKAGRVYVDDPSGCVETKGRHRQITVSSRTGATRIEVWSGHQKQPFPISRSRLALPSAGSPSGSARYPIEFNRRWLRWSRSQIWPCMSSVVAPSGSPARLLARSERSREIPREQRSAIRRGRRRLG